MDSPTADSLTLWRDQSMTAPLDDYELVTDETGSVHLFAVGYLGAASSKNAGLYHLVYRQGLWLAPQRLFYNADMRPEWPKAVLGLTNDIHLTWFTRGLSENSPVGQDTAADVKLFYSHMEGNFPLSATQAFNSTRTPLPSPSPFQVLRPTLTPFPTAQVDSRDVFVATNDQYSSLTLLGGLGAATLFCALVLLIVRLRR